MHQDSALLRRLARFVKRPTLPPSSAQLGANLPKASARRGLDLNNNYGFKANAKARHILRTTPLLLHTTTRPQATHLEEDAMPANLPTLGKPRSFTGIKAEFF